MVASIAATSNVNYLIEQAQGDYYTQGGEPQGQWIGSGAAALGLTGQVQRADYLAVTEGFSPKDKSLLVQNAGEGNRQKSWDITFSSPKSVSTLWAVADEATRKEIEHITEASVKSVLRYIDANLINTRRGKGGQIQEASSLVGALFQHGTNRNNEPHLHYHAIIKNVTVRQDGSTGTIISKPLYDNKMFLGALFRAEQSARLDQAGFLTERKERSYELIHRDENLDAEFSSRRKEIKADLQARGFSSAQAAAVSNLSTRKKKQHHLPRETLLKQWQATAKEYGLSPDTARELYREKPRLRNTDEQKEHAGEIAARRLANKYGAFRAADLAREVATEAQTRGLMVSDVQAAIMRQEEKLVVLDKGYYTTKAHLKREVALVELLQDAKHTRSHEVNREVMLHKSKEHTLNPGQANALAHITDADNGSVRFIEGLPGTGKTRLMKAAAETWKQEGYQVVGTALAGQAADTLRQEAGLDKAYSLSSLLLSQRLAEEKNKPTPINQNTIIVVDEAGMAGLYEKTTLDDGRVYEVGTLPLLQKANAYGATVVMIGDRNQLSSITAAGGFAYGVDALQAAKLIRIHRQHKPEDRNALHRFVEAKDSKKKEKRIEKLEKALENFSVNYAAKASTALRRMVAKWKYAHVETPQEGLMLVETKAQARKVNEMAQRARIEAGVLKETGGIQVGDVHIYERDRVLFNRNSKVHEVWNGSKGTVLRVSGTRMHVQLDEGKTIWIDSSEYIHISLGYASTTHKAQGATVRRVYAFSGEHTSRQLSFVQFSRHKEQVNIFTINASDEQKLRQKKEKKPKKERLFAARVEKSQAKGLVLKQFEEQLGGKGVALRRAREISKENAL